MARVPGTIAPTKRKQRLVDMRFGDVLALCEKSGVTLKIEVPGTLEDFVMPEIFRDLSIVERKP